MMLGLGSLGVVSAEAERLAAELGGRIVQSVAPSEIPGFPASAGEHEIVLPDGTRISAEGLSMALSRSEPGTETGVLQTMITTAKVLGGASPEQAVRVTAQEYPELFGPGVYVPEVGWPGREAIAAPITPAAQVPATRAAAQPSATMVQATAPTQPSITTTSRLQTDAEAGRGIGDWLRDNQTMLLIGAGAVVLLLVFKGKG